MRDMYEDAGEFTTNMLNKFWDINYEDSENYNDVLKFLNQAENFRTFNDGLTEFIKKQGAQLRYLYRQKRRKVASAFFCLKIPPTVL